MTLEGADDEVFEATHFDLRAPGEHYIDGEACDLEVQIFHTKKSDVNKHLVLSVCFEVGSSSNSFIEQVIDGINVSNDIDLMDAFGDVVTIGEYI